MLPVSRRFDPNGFDFLLRPILRQLDDMFAAADVAPRHLGEHGRQDFSPSYELDETEEHYLVCFDVPGMSREDMDIELKGDRLIVSGSRVRKGRHGEDGRSTFQRIFTLPDGVSAESIVAECKDGVLRLAIRKPAAVQPTKISIGDGQGRTSGGFFKSLVDKKTKTAGKSNDQALAN